MGWMSNLIDTYDQCSAISCNDLENPLLPIGFIQKSIKFNIILSAEGDFVTAQILPESEQFFVVPTSPKAENRTKSIAAYPLADQLKYLIDDGEVKNPRFQCYLQQLTEWSYSPGAPKCLQTLVAYLNKGTLLQDLSGVPALKLKYYKDTSKKELGPDAQSVACFSVQNLVDESRLWLRADVRESWSQHYLSLLSKDIALCYASGERLPVMQGHPKVEGNAKLISAKDDDYPFQYKGRFVENRSSASVSAQSSVKAHNALKWLVNRQGFKRYGLTVVAWNVNGYAVKPPIDDAYGLNLEDVRQTEADTFESYGIALRNAALGYGKAMESFCSDPGLTDATRKRMNEIVILGMEAATDGRMSIIYYQELPGNEYVKRLEKWFLQCCWKMPGQVQKVKAPTPEDIAKAVMGSDQVVIAAKDVKCTKSATKRMREIRVRLMDCVVNSDPLPLDLLKSAFQRSVVPLQFTDTKGRWQPFSWDQCVSTTCALIRKYRFDQRLLDPKLTELLPKLDMQNCERDYLYGRLLAVAHKLEQEAQMKSASKENVPQITNAIRLMAAFVRCPLETWEKIHAKLLPYLKTLGSSGRANSYQRIIGRIEQKFQGADRLDPSSLSYLFLVGFHLQMREFYAAKDDRQIETDCTRYQLPSGRDELFGCILAVADAAEWFAEREAVDSKHGSRRDGSTNALLLMTAFAARPVETWAKIHDRLIPYLEKMGVTPAHRIQRLIRQIELRFTLTDRLSNAPLGSAFLHGYYCMRAALFTHEGLDESIWSNARHDDLKIDSREAAYGALLAAENSVERIVLDMEKDETKNRPSNTMRFLARAAQKPCEVWTYLSQRMKPYEKKLGYQPFLREIDHLHREIEAHGWDTDTPLGESYLHYFYIFEHQKEEEHQQ